MASFIDKIQKIPTKFRIIGFGIFVVALISVFIWLKQIPMQTEIDQLKASLSQLNAKIQSNDAKIQKLDDLKAEVAVLRGQLVILTRKLPPESEVSDLLRQIQRLVNQSGLMFKIWKPSKRRTHESGLYEEISIAMTLTGGYHNTAMLFDQISRLDRIVNVLNIKMGGMKTRRDGSPEVTITCTAMTFAAVEKKGNAETTNK
jgi:type IV pilus assembly protein PilO